MKIRYFINASGGGIGFIGLLVALLTLNARGIYSKICSGVSAGSIVMFLYYSDKLKSGLLLARKSYDPRIIFSKRNDPQGKIAGKFSLRALWNLLRKRTYLGKMDNLEKNLKDLVSIEDWDRIQKSSDIDCYIHCIDRKTGQKVSFNLRFLSRDQAVRVVIGSASIAGLVPASRVIVNSVEYDLVDGGHKDSSAGSYLLKSGIVKPDDFDECITIWRRSGLDTFGVKQGYEPDNLGDVIEDVIIGYPMAETAIDDEIKEREFCEDHGKIYSPIHVSFKTESVYSITKAQIANAELVAAKAVNDYIETHDSKNRR